MKNFKSSPLWMIAFFMTFAEGTAGFAVSQTDGATQDWLVIFVIAYAVVVTGVFFGFLWFRPANFYAPSEYGDMPPREFAQALGGVPVETARAVEEAQRNPFDHEAVFELLDNLLPEDVKQHVVLLNRTGGAFDVSNIDENGHTHRYEIILRSKGISMGLFSPRKFLNRLDGTGFAKVSGAHDKILLTERGKQFAEWLTKHEKDAETFSSGIGQWGPKQTVSEVMRAQAEAHNKALQATADGGA